MVGRENVANPVDREARGRGARVAVFLARQGVDVLLTIEDDLGNGARYVLEANGVETIARPGLSLLDDALRALSENVAGVNRSPKPGL